MLIWNCSCKNSIAIKSFQMVSQLKNLTFQFNINSILS